MLETELTISRWLCCSGLYLHLLVTRVIYLNSRQQSASGLSQPPWQGGLAPAAPTWRLDRTDARSQQGSNGGGQSHGAAVHGTAARPRPTRPPLSAHAYDCGHVYSSVLGEICMS